MEVGRGAKVACATRTLVGCADEPSAPPHRLRPKRTPGVTAVDPKWLGRIAPGMCLFGKPLENPPPRCGLALGGKRGRGRSGRRSRAPCAWPEHATAAARGRDCVCAGWRLRGPRLQVRRRHGCHPLLVGADIRPAALGAARARDCVPPGPRPLQVLCTLLAGGLGVPGAGCVCGAH